jgi:hypothetical protein
VNGRLRHRGVRGARWPGSAADLAAAIGYGTWASAWQCDETSGNLADSIGAITLAAASSPLYSRAGAMPGDAAVGFDSTADAFAAASGTTFNITTTGQLAVYLCWKAPAVAATSYLFTKYTAGAYYLGFLDTSGRLSAAMWDGTTFYQALIAVANHCDGNYHDIIFTFDRDVEQRMTCTSDMGSSAESNISTANSISNAGAFSLGGASASSFGSYAYAAVATAGVPTLKANAVTAIANVRRFTGRG